MERLERYAPPGMGITGLCRWTLGALMIAAFFSMSFIIEYASELRELTREMEYPVFSGLNMIPFADLIVVPMLLFRLAPLAPLLHIPTNYLYFTQETKCIYLMKRLKSPLELHLRCFALPVAGAVIILAAGYAVYFFYQLIYYTFTPEILLPASVVTGGL